MRARINGVAISYEDSGETALLPVVFIHGFPFNRAMWAPQAERLKGRFRVVTYDLRGLGASSAGDGQYAMEFFVDDLLGLLDRTGLDKAVLCGLSMGGYIALRTAEKAPERVHALVLCDTRSEADTDDGKLKRAAAMAAVKRNGGMKAFEGFLKQVFAPENLKRLPRTVGLVRKAIEANTPKGVCGALLALASRTDTTAFLAKIAVPALILVGEYDALTPPAAAEAMRAKIPGAKLRVIPGAGHLSNLENPSAFNRELEEFLSSL